MKTLTWADFKGACYDPQEVYGYFQGTILDILNDSRIPEHDKIWAFSREGIMDTHSLRVFALKCVKEVKHLMPKSSQDLMDVVERYLNGNATEAELNEAAAELNESAAAQGLNEGARTAAWVAAWVAEAAVYYDVSDTVWDAAWAADLATWVAEGAAARSGMRKRQVQIAIEICNQLKTK